MNTLDVCLHGNLRNHVMREFFTNSAHFPVVLALLEFLLNGLKYFQEPDFYALLGAAALQAWWIGRRAYQGKACPLWGNLIAPALYTAAEVLLELDDDTLLDGFIAFFLAPHHLAFWVFALTIGFLQHLRSRNTRRLAYGLLIMLENLARTLVLGVMYFIFEQAYHTGKQGLLEFFLFDQGHLFVLSTLTFTGLLLGAANLNADTFLRHLQQTSRQLQTYSAWLLGRQLLNSALQDPSSLTLTRRERAVLFMDIRGFTAWSEAQAPERVVDMLNGYFEAAEACWAATEVSAGLIKIKHTGDEIMAVFDTPQTALSAARCLHAVMADFLRPYSLGAGIGAHYGALVEGLLGSREVRGYDVIGDTVNTAKRICDHAAAGELLLSRAFCDHLPAFSGNYPRRQVRVKGKSTALELVVLTWPGEMGARDSNPSPRPDQSGHASHPPSQPCAFC